MAVPPKEAGTINPIPWDSMWSYTHWKKRRGWGGEAVVSPGEGVQAAELLYGIRRGGDGHVDLLSFGLFDVPAVGIPQAGEYLPSPRRQVEGMAVMPFGRLFVLKKSVSSPELQGFPLLFFAKSDRRSEHLWKLQGIGNDRFAIIGERERYASFAGEEAVDVHAGEQRRQDASLPYCKINRLVVIESMEDFGPG